MKRLFFILFSFVSLSLNAQYGEFYDLLLQNGGATYTPPSVVSNIKNPKVIPNALSKQYISFGNNINLGSDTATLSDTSLLFVRAGTSHIAGGVPVMNIYHISTDTWDGFSPLRTDTTDNRDVWATKMDNDSILIVSELSFNDAIDSHTGNPQPGTTQIYFIRMGRDLGHTDTINFRWPAGAPRLQRSYVYSKAAYLDTPGHYLMTLVQFNVDTGNLSRLILDVVKTTDYYRSYRIVNVFDGTGFNVDETDPLYLGGGRVSLLTRIYQGSVLYHFTSRNGGETWPLGSTNQGVADSLWWYKAGGDLMAYQYKVPKKDSVIVFYGNRDNNCIEVSLWNRPDSFSVTNHFNSPQIYYYNKTDDNSAPSALNYPTVSAIKGDSVFLTTWAHQKNADSTVMYYTRDNFITDPAGVPVAPPTLTISSKTTTSFRVDIDGYTQAQKNNIRTFYFDLSTDPAFGSFVTAKFQSPTITASVSLHNINMHSYWDVFNSLTTGTTYYLRIKACNNAGCSSYTTQTITTN